MDCFDRAQELEQWQREVAIDEARSHAPHGVALMHCQDCGEVIPPERREASHGCTRCAECQRYFEHEQSMRGRR